MTLHIKSDMIKINKPENISTEVIEKILESRCGNLIRWAIVDITEKELNICVTYEKETS